MRKYTETFHAAQGYRFQLSFLHQLNCFQDRNLWHFFQTLSARKRGMAHPTFVFYCCLNVIFHKVLLYALSVKKLLLKLNFFFQLLQGALIKNEKKNLPKKMQGS